MRRGMGEGIVGESHDGGRGGDDTCQGKYLSQLRQDQLMWALMILWGWGVGRLTIVGVGQVR